MVENDKGVLVKEYTLYKNPEGKMVAKNIEWHKANGTYTASYIIGAIDVYKRQLQYLYFIKPPTKSTPICVVRVLLVHCLFVFVDRIEPNLVFLFQ